MRSPWDSRGHAMETVRDREAPGSNPGPPTRIRIQLTSRQVGPHCPARARYCARAEFKLMHL
jgi:hypothetical protein